MRIERKGGLGDVDVGMGWELTLLPGCRSAIVFRGHGHSRHPCLADFAIPHPYHPHIHIHTLLHLHHPLPALPSDDYTPPSADSHTHYRYSTTKTVSSLPKPHIQNTAMMMTMKGQVVNSVVGDA